MKKMMALISALVLLSCVSCGKSGEESGSENGKTASAKNSSDIPDNEDDKNDEDDDTDNYSTEFTGAHRLVAYGNKNSEDDMISYVLIDIIDDNSYVLYKVSGEQKTELFKGGVRSHSEDIINLDVDIPDDAEIFNDHYFSYLIKSVIGQSDYRLYDDGCIFISNLDGIREYTEITYAATINKAFESTLTDCDARGCKFCGVSILASNGYGYNDKVILPDGSEGVLSETLKTGLKNYFDKIYEYEYIAILINTSCVYVVASDSWESSKLSIFPSSAPGGGYPYFTGKNLKDILSQIKAGDKNYKF